MENFLNWIQSHWPELAAFFGIGGAGVVGGKKWVDAKQDSEIKQLKAEVSNVKKMAYENQNAIQLLEKDLSENRRLDGMLRDEMKEDRKELKEAISQLGAKVDKVVDYLLNQRK